MAREYPEAPVAGVGAVVIRGTQRGGEVLLVRRGTPPLLGRWSLPGGVLELGETLTEGIVREVFEETALHITPLAIVESFDRIHRDVTGRVQYHYVLIDFLCRWDGGEIVSGDDAQEGCWAAREHISTDGPYKLEPLTCSVIEKAFVMARSLGL